MVHNCLFFSNCIYVQCSLQLAVDEAGNDARHSRDVIVDEDGWLQVVNPAWCLLRVRECQPLLCLDTCAEAGTSHITRMMPAKVKRKRRVK